MILLLLLSLGKGDRDHDNTVSASRHDCFRPFERFRAIVNEMKNLEKQETITKRWSITYAHRRTYSGQTLAERFARHKGHVLTFLMVNDRMLFVYYS